MINDIYKSEVYIADFVMHLPNRRQKNPDTKVGIGEIGRGFAAELGGRT